MSRATLDQIYKIAYQYAMANKIAVSTFNYTADNFVILADKIGKILSLDGQFYDKLPEMDGDDLPFGKTIEEYFIDLPLVTDYDREGSKHGSPSDFKSRPAYYSYTLGRKNVKITIRNNEIERAVNNPEQFASVFSTQYKRLEDSYSSFKFGIKKGIIGVAMGMIDTAMAPTKTFATKTAYKNGESVKKDATTAGVVQTDIKADNAKDFDTLVKEGAIVVLSLTTKVAKPVDTKTAEDYIKALKNIAEEASFANQGNSLNGNAIGISEAGLVVYIPRRINSVVDVDAVAGAFNQEKIAYPIEIKVIDSFGDYAGKGWALVADKRSMKLHNTYLATREDPNGEGDFLNLIKHTENTAFISRNTYFKMLVTE